MLTNRTELVLLCVMYYMFIQYFFSFTVWFSGTINIITIMTTKATDVTIKLSLVQTLYESI